MRHKFQFILLIFLTVFGSFMVIAKAEQLVRPQFSISVNGIGRVDVAPDRADLTFTIETQAKNAEAARDQAAQAMKTVINALHNAEINDRDMQTRYIALTPVYEPNTNNKVIAYQLTNQLLVKIRDINKSSAIMDLAIKAGGDSVRVQNIAFAIDKPEAALSQAREKAYLDAKSKAEQYASLANVKLGKAQQIFEGTGFAPTPERFAKMSMSRSAGAENTPIQIGEQEVSVTVTVVFVIE